MERREEREGDREGEIRREIAGVRGAEVRGERRKEGEGERVGEKDTFLQLTQTGSCGYEMFTT